MSPFNLEGKTVLITGAAGFLGSHFAQAVSEAGGRVILTDLAGEAQKQLAKIADRLHDAAWGVMDVTNEKSVIDFFHHEKKVNQIDVVVNNAAIDPKFDKSAPANQQLFPDYPLELFQQSLKVNVEGYWLVAREAVTHMLNREKGLIINISSIYGEVGPDQRIYPEGTQKPADYSVTKAAVHGLTKWIATSYGHRGIRANTLTLGGVEKGHSDVFKQKYGARTPLGRMMKPEEIGGPLVFLASNAASYVTGANLVVDGGWAAW